MSATFYALKDDQVVGHQDITQYEIQVSNGNAYTIMRALGMPVDYRDHPAGNLPVAEFLRRVEHVIASSPDVNIYRYMIHLRRLAWASRQMDEIAWA